MTENKKWPTNFKNEFSCQGQMVNDILKFLIFKFIKNRVFTSNGPTVFDS